ncbi:zinc ribbon domain-containing protein [Neobacillus vireti]|uniref:Zinc ribbon domain-containing protein n=1 Tax=Neobacillus vireti LMG 21834 TaxID=1131730 RepID=A0AB94IRE4_9BACI|nr:zinc ribbon domain-containing protein [Neobacillus vireti]ETI69651.1 hypothetical protein BAVI_06294 [Neobacillus vireti LMG 21834]KLT18242.1 hypothetical protein AA980_07840 [Neobacillus vireti]
MQCPVCSHHNEGGKFCEQCGTKLEIASYHEAAPTAEPTMNQAPNYTSHQSYQQGNQQGYQQGNPQGYQQGNQQGYQQGHPQGYQQVNTQPNQYLEGAKNISKMYFGYFMEVLKKPYASSKSVGAEHFTNAIITIVLYSLIIPLMLYFIIKSFADSMFGRIGQISPPFLETVIYPTFTYAIFILLVATFAFAAVKLAKVNASYKEVISRFGSFLIPFLAILLIGFVLAILKAKVISVIFLVLGFSTALLIVPTLVIASFKKDTQDGLDVIYGTLFTYILTCITIAIMGEMLFERIVSAIEDAVRFF